MKEPMDTSEDRVIVEFITEYLKDRDASISRPLAHYLQLWAGFEEAIARQYFLLREEPTATGSSIPQGSVDRIGHYRLIEVLGRGGQGLVYRAFDEQLGRMVALKVLRGDFPDDEALVRFRREAELAGGLDHPGICTVFEVGREDGRSYIAMRLLPGQTLSAALDRRAGVPSASELRVCASWVEKAARAVQFAHDKGVVHRDLKPANLMLMPDEQVVVLDFGLARLADDSDGLTATGALFGTPAYMSPERLEGRPATALCDVYSLGVIAYRLATGLLPHEASTPEDLRRMVVSGQFPNPRTANPAVDRDLEVILATAMAREPEHRYASASALANDLAAWIEHRPIAARPASVWLRWRRWMRREPAMAASVVVLIVCLLGGLTMALAFLARERGLRTDLLRASDVDRAGRYLESEQSLYPVDEGLPERAKFWLSDVDSLLSRRSVHTEGLRHLRLEIESSPPNSESNAESKWHAAILEEILHRLDRLEGRREAVQSRIKRAQSLRERTGSDDLWEKCRESIRLNGLYRGLDIPRQSGLMPLQEDPETGFWDFLVVDSGERPKWDQKRNRWRIEGDSGIVLVLLPGGEFTMGGVGEGSSARVADLPPRSVNVEPFLISRFEMTQAQWMRLAEGENPSYYEAGKLGGLADQRRKILPTDPVEQVDWHRAVFVLASVGLRLPLESEWEYAARGGTTTAFFTGDDVESTQGYANLQSLELPEEQRSGTPVPWRDGYATNAPVGTFEGNPFGLFDTMGNVLEWCADAWLDPPAPAADSPGLEARRAYRGGGAVRPTSLARSFTRGFSPPTAKSREVGLRPARSLSGR